MRRILVAIALCCASVTAIAAPAYKGMSLTSFNPTDLASAHYAAIDRQHEDARRRHGRPQFLVVSKLGNRQHDGRRRQQLDDCLGPVRDRHDSRPGHEGPPQADARRKRRHMARLHQSDPARYLVWLRRDQSFHQRSAAPLVGSFGNFIDTFADIAQTKGVEMLSIGCEMNNMENATNSTRWTNLIDNVRTHYTGPLTYSANWSTAGTPPGGGAAWQAATTT